MTPRARKAGWVVFAILAAATACRLAGHLLGVGWLNVVGRVVWLVVLVPVVLLLLVAAGHSIAARRRGTPPGVKPED